MAKQTINIGTADFAGDGESLRSAFQKVNSNFDEVYTDLASALSINTFDGDYNSLANLPDLTGYALTVNTFNGDYNNLSNLPSLFDGNYNSLANKPTVPTTIDSLTNVNISSVQEGQVLAFDNTSGSWINATPNIPADVSDLTDTEGLLGGGANTGDFVFSNNFLTVEGEGVDQVVIQGETDGDARIDIPNNDWAENSKALTISNRGAQGVEISTGLNADYTWTFGSDGSLTFPDNTVQTTAYATGVAGSPLFVVVNTDGTTSWSTDGTTWSTPVTLVFNGNPDVNRVAVADSYITYTCYNQDTDLNNQLWYATTYGIEPTLVSSLPATGTSYYEWYDIQHGGNYTVAVGNYTEDDGIGGFQDPVPVWAYTTNGSAWTLGDTDGVYQGIFGGSFNSVDYDGTGWLFANESQGNGGGAFYLTDLTGQLGEGNLIDFVANGLEAVPDIGSVVWTGNRWWLKDTTSTVDYFVSDGANPLTATWSYVNIASTVADAGFGNVDFFEDAGGEIDGTYWFAVASSGGQVLASSDGGANWTTSVPLAYTGTLDSATEASPCVIQLSQTPSNGTKIVITNANPINYNGTYYTDNNGDGYNLYTDSELTTPLDSTLFGTFVSADVEFTSGMYIDSFGFGLGKFLAGNDDEQLFTSTDLTTWTKVDDQDNAFNYWEDISFNANWGAGAPGAPAVTTGDITFNGVKIIGAGSASGDGNSFGTIELVPDNSRYNNDQYLVIDPTVPNHIHIRAGGTQDASNATLILGGEQANVTVNDFNHNLIIKTWNGDATNYEWLFGEDGILTLPNSNYLETSDTSLAVGSQGTVTIRTNAQLVETTNSWIFGTDASTTLPGAVIASTVTPTPGTFAVGEAISITVTNSPNANWNTGSEVTAGDITFTVAVDGSGNATVSVISDGGTGHFVGETFGPVGGSIFGGTDGVDDMNFQIIDVNLGSVTALDLTKQVQILTAELGTGTYSLADGVEGQIMYFVPNSTVSATTYLLIANARIIGEGPQTVTDYSWTPFSGETLAPATIAMAIFADGAWCLRGGATD